MAEKHGGIAIIVKPNSQGSLVGTWGPLQRIAAQLYRIPSADWLKNWKPGTLPPVEQSYLCYVESIPGDRSEDNRKAKPKQRYRCECSTYLYLAICKHGPVACMFETAIQKSFPKERMAELRRRDQDRPNKRIKDLMIPEEMFT